MSVSARTQNIIRQALADKPAGDEVISKLVGVKAAAIAALTISATTGTLPTPNGSVTVANAATPTVSELLEAVMELNAKLDAIRAALTGAGVSA